MVAPWSGSGTESELRLLSPLVMRTLGCSAIG